jgi:hypothetical protein
MGSVLNAAAPAIVLEVLDKKVRRVNACEAEIILFMALGIVSDARHARGYSTVETGARAACGFRSSKSSGDSGAIAPQGALKNEESSAGKSSQHQAPSSRETPNPNLQNEDTLGALR